MVEYDHIKNACTAFLKKYPELDDVEEIYGACEWYSNRFCEDFPELNAKVLYLEGYRHIYPNRHANHDKNLWPNPDPYFLHVVVLVQGNIVIDPTYRQLDILAKNFYTIITYEEFKQNWFLIASDWDTLDAFGAIGTCLQQAAEENLRPVEKKKIDFIISNQQSAKKCYFNTLSNIRDGKLKLTGTTLDNPHLDLLENTWSKLFTD